MAAIVTLADAESRGCAAREGGTSGAQDIDMLRTTLCAVIAAAAFACGGSSPSRQPTSGSTASTSPRDGTLASIRRGVDRKSDTRFEVRRDALQEIFAHEPELVAAVRVVPETEGGSVVGVRVFGVTRDSLLGVLGIEDGDRIDRVNGHDMATRAGAEATVAELRRIDHATVVLNRRGVMMTLEYSITQG